MNSLFWDLCRLTHASMNAVMTRHFGFETKLNRKAEQAHVKEIEKIDKGL